MLAREPGEVVEDEPSDNAVLLMSESVLLDDGSALEAAAGVPLGVMEPLGPKAEPWRAESVVADGSLLLADVSALLPRHEPADISRDVKLLSARPGGIS